MKRPLLAATLFLTVLFAAGCCEHHCEMREDSWYYTRYCRTHDAERVRYDKCLQKHATEVVQNEADFFGEQAVEMLTAKIESEAPQTLLCNDASSPSRDILSWTVSGKLVFGEDSGEPHEYYFIGFNWEKYSRQAKLRLGEAELVAVSRTDADSPWRKRVRTMTAYSIEDAEYELVEGEWVLTCEETKDEPTILWINYEPKKCEDVEKEEEVVEDETEPEEEPEQIENHEEETNEE